MSIDYPMINGFRYSFANVTANVSTNSASILLRGLTELNFSEEVSPGEVRGNRPQKMGETAGEYTVSGSFVMLKEDFEAFVSQLAPPGSPLGYMMQRFTVSVSYGDLSTSGNVNSCELRGVRIVKAEDSAAEGSDALTVSCDLTIMELYRNGGVSAIGTMYQAK